jgi:hypothetical protein
MELTNGRGKMAPTALILAALTAFWRLEWRVVTRGEMGAFACSIIGR